MDCTAALGLPLAAGRTAAFGAAFLGFGFVATAARCFCAGFAAALTRERLCVTGAAFLAVT